MYPDTTSKNDPIYKSVYQIGKKQSLINLEDIKMIAQLQQGDINIVRTKTRPEPDKLKEIDGGVVAEGEALGHKHRIIGTEFKLHKIVGLTDVLFADIVSDDCRIVHEEHGTIDLPIGEYYFSPTIEYDHFAERSRIVRD
jgi:hypothetical protein